MPQFLVQGELVFEPAPSALHEAVILIRLEDTTFAGAPAHIIAEQRLTKLSPQEIEKGRCSFMLEAQINNLRNSYNVSAHVDMDGDGVISRGDYISMESYPVLTHGYSNQVRVRVHPVR